MDLKVNLIPILTEFLNIFNICYLEFEFFFNYKCINSWTKKQKKTILSRGWCTWNSLTPPPHWWVESNNLWDETPELTKNQIGKPQLMARLAGLSKGQDKSFLVNYFAWIWNVGCPTPISAFWLNTVD